MGETEKSINSFAKQAGISCPTEIVWQTLAGKEHSAKSTSAKRRKKNKKTVIWLNSVRIWLMFNHFMGFNTFSTAGETFLTVCDAA